MSITIKRKEFEYPEDSNQPIISIIETKFNIYRSDSLKTIKDRYFIENNIFPYNSAVFELEENVNLTYDTKTIKVDGPDSSLNISEEIQINIVKDKKWDINPLENEVFNCITFRDLADENPLDLEDMTNFNKTLNKLTIKAMEILKLKDKKEVLFLYVIIYYATDYNETYEESFNAVKEYSYSETFALFEYLNKYKLEYEKFYNNNVFGYSAITNEELLKEERDQYEDFLSEIELLDLSDLKTNPIKTRLIQTNYIYEGSCVLKFDGYELFNKIKPDKIVSFLNIGKFYKLLNNFKYPDEWISEDVKLGNYEDDTTLRFYMYGKKSEMDVVKSKDYIMVELIQTNEIDGKFYFDIIIEASTEIEISEEEIIKRLLNYISLPKSYEDPTEVLDELIVPQDIKLKKLFGNGFFVYKNISMLKELFFDFVTNHPLIRKLIIIDEKYKIEKERGGIRFYMSTNNFQTLTKFTLYYKKLNKISDPELELFPNELEYNDDIMLIKVNYATNKNDLDKMINYLSSIMVYILENKKDYFTNYYNKFIKNLSDLYKIDFVDDEKGSLKSIYPQLFIPGYARVCQKQPKAYRLDDFIDDDDAMLFPLTKEEGKQFYYSCKDQGRNKYVGLIENNLENKDKFPYIPCCYSDNQKKENTIRYIYENELTLESKVSGFNEIITSKKLLREGQYGTLPEHLLQLFNIIDVQSLMGRNRFLRYGIKQGNFSVLYAILTALKISITDENINKYLDKLYKFSEYNLVSQRGLTVNDVKKILNKKDNIDPLLFLELLENVFKVNIILFCMDRTSQENKKGFICSNTSSNRNYILNSDRKLYDTTILLYRTMGGEFDRLKYPHVELIVKQESSLQILSDKSVSGSVYKKFSSSNEVIRELYSIYLTSQKITYSNLSFKSKIVKQVEDGYGKIRVLVLLMESPTNGIGKEILNIVLNPSPTFYEEQFNNKIEYHSGGLKSVELNLAIEWLIYEDIKKINTIIYKDKLVGISGYNGNTKLFIPINDSVENLNRNSRSKLLNIEYLNQNLEEYPYPNIYSVSLIDKYQKFLKISNYLLSNVLYLFSIINNEELKILRLIITSENSEEKIKEIIENFKNNIKIKDDINFSLIKRKLPDLDNPNNLVINNKTIYVPNNNVKEKLLYILYINTKYNLSEVIDYSQKKYVLDFYTSKKDFIQSEHFSIFFTFNELKFSKRKMETYKTYSIIPDQKIDIFFLQNPFIVNNKILICQKCLSLNHALYVSKEWFNKRINKSSYFIELDNKKENYTLYIYTINENGEGMISVNDIVNNDSITNPNYLLKFNNEYYSLLTME